MVCPIPRQHTDFVRKIAIILVAVLAFVTICSQYFSVLEDHSFATNYSNPVMQQLDDLTVEKLSQPQVLHTDFAFKKGSPGVLHHDLSFEKGSTQLLHNDLAFERGSPHIVLILAYMHTGSSYVGELFQHRPNTFYLFEPLRSLRHKIQGKVIKYLNGTVLHMTEETYKNVGAQSIVDMFSCNHSNLDIATLTEQYNSDGSIRLLHLRDYFRCLRQQCKKVHIGGDSTVETTRGVCGSKYTTNVQKANKAIHMCLDNIITKCKNSKLRAIKMIRMSMDMAELALKTFPNMRIIHLVRDPRAMLDSNARRGEMGAGVLSKYQERAELMCGRMATDLRRSEQLKGLYHGKIFTLRYEDMVEDPMGIAESIYNFVQVPFIDSDKSFVRRKSIDADRNSTVRANTWRTHIDQTHLNVVENACDDLFQMLGYKKLKTIKEVRNLAVTDHKREVDIV